jgi:DNA-binding transcriptional ArsR family regulator
MDADLLTGLRALVDQHRLRIVARLAAGPVDPENLARDLKLPVHLVRKQLEVLAHAGLVEPRPDRPGTLGVRMDRVGQLGRELAMMEREAEGLPGIPGGAWPHDGEPLADTLARLRPSPEEARTLRAFLVDGQLVSIPVASAKRQIVLRFLLERVFAEDREYPEKEVNARLALFHPDVASLRRYLYDERYVDREAGLYRRRGPRPELPGQEAPDPALDPREPRPAVFDG